MIESFLKLMSLCLEFMKTPITVGGFTFSYYQIMIFTMVFGAVCILVRGFYGE